MRCFANKNVQKCGFRPSFYIVSADGVNSLQGNVKRNTIRLFVSIGSDSPELFPKKSFRMITVYIFGI